MLLLRRVFFLLSSPSPRAPLAKPLLLLRPPKTLAPTARQLVAMSAPAPSAGGAGAMSRDAFRAAVTNTLERRLFFVPSFKIYGGVAGLYDYGPPGCAVKANVLAFWRQVLYYYTADGYRASYLALSILLLGTFEGKASQFAVLIDSGLTRKRAAAGVLGAGF